jgi:hypothetical protein
MPNTTKDQPIVSTEDAALIDMAYELRRLATGLLKDVRKRAALPGLSQITAMRPLQDLLAEALAEKAFNVQDQESEPAPKTAKDENWFGFGIRPRE